MSENIMSNADQEVARLAKNAFLDLCLTRKMTTLTALAAARCTVECLEEIINEQGGEVFEVSQCKCQTDRGVMCFLCLSASRLRIMAREFERRKDRRNAVCLRELADQMESATK